MMGGMPTASATNTANTSGLGGLVVRVEQQLNDLIHGGSPFLCAVSALKSVTLLLLV